MINIKMVTSRKKKSEISADFSVVGGSGKKNPWKKSFERILAKNRRFFEKNRKNSDISPIFRRLEITRGGERLEAIFSPIFRR